MEKLNGELTREGIENFTREDVEAIEETVNGAFGRPHIADYLVKRRIVATRQEAFERYLVNCNVPNAQDLTTMDRHHFGLGTKGI